MKKELVSAGKPYLSVLYFSIFILTTLIFVTNFRSVQVGIIFLFVLVIKYYTGSALLVDLACCSLFRQKLLLNKRQIKINATIVICLLLLDMGTFFYLPDLAKLNYTTVSLLLFLLIVGQYLLSRLKKNYAYPHV